MELDEVKVDVALLEAGGGGGAAAAAGGGECYEGPPGWDDLPDEVLSRVLGLLSARQVSALAPCSRRTRDACAQPSVWAALLERDFDAPPGAAAAAPSTKTFAPRAAPGTSGLAAGGGANGGAGGANGALRAQYARRYREVMGQRQRGLRRRDRHVIEVRRRVVNRRWARAYRTFHVRVVSASLPLLVFVGTLLAALHLDGKGGVTLAGVFAPAWVLLSLVVAGVGSICLVRLWPRARFLQREHVSDGCLPVASEELVRDGTAARAVAVMLLACGVLFTAFLQARLDGSVGWPYGAVFVPVWAAFLLVCVAPCTGWVDSDDRWPTFAVSWLGLLPLLVTLALLVARLDGADGISVTLMLIPLWVFNGLVIVCPLLAFLTALVAHNTPLRDACGGLFSRRSAVTDNARLCVISWLLFVPACLFEILLALDDEGQGGRSYTTIFAPLLVWESAAVVLGFLAAVVV